MLWACVLLPRLALDAALRLNQRIFETTLDLILVVDRQGTIAQVSPSVETMGRRLEVLWRLRSPDRCPAIVVAGVRALLQHLGPGATEVEPVHVAKGAVLDPDVKPASHVAVANALYCSRPDVVSLPARRS